MVQSLIAANTKRIIADKGLKQRAVAAKAGFSEKQFSALMTGRRIIKDTDVMSIAIALDATPNELFGYPSDQNTDQGSA